MCRITTVREEAWKENSEYKFFICFSEEALGRSEILYCHIPGCKETFKLKFKFDKHIIDHSHESNGKPQSVNVDLRDRRKRLLRTFKSSYGHPKILKCDLCGREVKRRPEIIYHMLLHHVDRKYWAFKCGICGRKFVRNFDLQVHLDRHESKLLKVPTIKLFFMTQFQMSGHSNVLSMVAERVSSPAGSREGTNLTFTAISDCSGAPSRDARKSLNGVNT